MIPNNTSKIIFIQAVTLKPLALPPKFCEFTADVVKSGVYDKSICVDSFISTYDDAKANCEQNGMRLLSLDSTEASSAIISLATSKLPKFLEFVMFVAGKSGVNSCSTFYNLGGSFKQGNSSCDAVLQSTCEFLRNNREFWFVNNSDKCLLILNEF